MDGILVSVLRTVTSFILLILVTLMIGRHINAHKTHYNFALNITIGSFIANMGFNTKLDFIGMLMGFLSLVSLFYILLLVSSRSRKVRSWVSGKPTVLIEDGEILENNMRKIYFSLDDLNQRLRGCGVFDLFEVEYAVLEVSGELSVLKKKAALPITKLDLDLTTSRDRLPLELIIEGNVIAENTNGRYNDEWIKTECQKRKISIGDIYYAVVNRDGNLFVDMYDNKKAVPVEISEK